MSSFVHLYMLFIYLTLPSNMQHFTVYLQKHTTLAGACYSFQQLHLNHSKIKFWYLKRCIDTSACFTVPRISNFTLTFE